MNGYQDQQTLEEDQRTWWPKCCDNNKDKDISQAVNNYEFLSQEFKQNNYHSVKYWKGSFVVIRKGIFLKTKYKKKVYFPALINKQVYILTLIKKNMFIHSLMKKNVYIHTRPLTGWRRCMLYGRNMTLIIHMEINLSVIRKQDKFAIWDKQSPMSVNQVYHQCKVVTDRQDYN